MIGFPDLDSRQGLEIFIFATVSILALGPTQPPIHFFYRGLFTVLGPTQPPIQWIPGALFLVVKWPGREADHSPPSRAEVKNAWSYTSNPQYVFMAWCLIKRRETLPLPFHKSLCGAPRITVISKQSPHETLQVEWSLKQKTIYEGVSKSFRTESITNYTLTTVSTHWGATQRIMAAKLTTVAHKIAIQLHPVAQSCTIYSFIHTHTHTHTRVYRHRHTHISKNSPVESICTNLTTADTLLLL
jgi:hypothetical protein